MDYRPWWRSQEALLQGLWVDSSGTFVGWGVSALRRESNAKELRWRGLKGLYGSSDPIPCRRLSESSNLMGINIMVRCFFSTWRGTAEEPLIGECLAQYRDANMSAVVWKCRFKSIVWTLIGFKWPFGMIRHSFWLFLMAGNHVMEF